MKNKNKLIFSIFIISFSLASLIFVAKILLDVISQPKFVPASNIPALNTEKLNSSVDYLKTKANIVQKENIDYSRIIFGNQEPFNR